MFRRTVRIASAPSMVVCLAATLWGVRSEWRDDYLSHGNRDGCLTFASRRGAFSLIDIGIFSPHGAWAAGSQTVNAMPSIVLSEARRAGVVPNRPRQSWGGAEFSRFVGGAYGPAVPAAATFDRVQPVRWLTIPWAWPAALFAILPTIQVLRFLRSRPRVRPGRCANCGYDLRASPERCPECGTPRTNKSEIVR